MPDDGALEGTALYRLKKRVFCDWLNLHVGYPEARDGTMYFYCTRCNSLNHPAELPDDRLQAVERRR